MVTKSLRTKSLLGGCNWMRKSDRLEWDEDEDVRWFLYLIRVTVRCIKRIHSGKNDSRRKMSDTQTQHVLKLVAITIEGTEIQNSATINIF